MFTTTASGPRGAKRCSLKVEPAILSLVHTHTHTHTHTQLVSLRHHLLLACSESETLTRLYKQQLASLDLEECHTHLRCVPFDLSTRLPGNKDLDHFMEQAREGRSSDSRLDRWREGGREGGR